MSDEQESEGFTPFRLRGGRYEGTGFPLEGLPELARYERLLVDVARGLWRVENPDRQRLPRGFAGRLQLRLIRVERGSVVPVMVRASESGAQGVLLDDVDSVFDKAKNLVERTFDAIVHNEDLPTELPAEVVAEFLRFGSGLRENEQAIFSSGARTAAYDRSVRKNFLRRVSSERFSVEGIELGRVTSLDADAQEFGLTNLRGVLVKGFYANSSLTPDFRKVLDSRNLASVVRIDGIISINENDETVQIEDVSSVEVFEIPDAAWSSRLLDLAALNRGWLDGQGDTVSFSALDFGRDLLRELTDRKIVSPGIFPMPDGGVQMEWQKSPRVVSVEVSPALDVALYRLDTTTDEEEDFNTTDVVAAADFIAEALRDER